MDLLSENTGLLDSWKQATSNKSFKRLGVQQFLRMFYKHKDRDGDELLFGDELEYVLVQFDDDRKTAKLSLEATEVLKKLLEGEEYRSVGYPVNWQPEYGAYMLEATPRTPYREALIHLKDVEENMKIRRKLIQDVLGKNVCPILLAAYPRTGCVRFTFPEITNPKEGAGKSLFYPEEAITDFTSRYRMVGDNMLKRRGEAVINIPMFKDTYTESPHLEYFSTNGVTDGKHMKAKPGHVFMDAIGFGCGCCGLQVTLQAPNLHDACVLYDQLTPFCPILLALTAASPIHGGYLTDHDVRWSILSQATDDRTEEEKGEKPLKKSQFVIDKPRWGSVPCYLTTEYCNDERIVYDEELYKCLTDGGVDKLLAQHIAHLFIRDPLLLHHESTDEEDTSAFENMNSTVWTVLRFKPPTSHGGAGWRVEFRTMEVQLTEFENAAFVAFLVLLSRIILSQQVDFRIPISKIDKNYETAYKRNAVKEGLFHFRENILRPTTGIGLNRETLGCQGNDTYVQRSDSRSKQQINGDTFAATLMTMDEIINGKKGFPGLVPLMKDYIKSETIDSETDSTISSYLDLISQRASGRLKTIANWIRDQVHLHPGYKHDSVVTDAINYSILKKCQQISAGILDVKDLLPRRN